MGQKRNLLLLPLLLLLTAPIRAKETSSVEAKITLEESLERRLKSVITQILGNNDVIVIVTADMFTEDEKKNKDVPPAQESAVLPGVPVKEKIGEADALAGLSLGDSRTTIKRLTASVVLDKSVSETDANVIKTVTTGLLALKTDRGDTLQVQRMDFHKGESTFQWRKFLQPPDIFWVMGLCLLALFIFFTTIFFFSSFRVFTREFVKALRSYGDSVQEQNKMAQMQKDRAPELAGRGDEDNTEIDAIVNKKSAPVYVNGNGSIENGKNGTPFSFINESHLRNLKILLKKESASYIAVVVNYLPPIMANDIVASLEPAKQSEVMSLLSRVSEMDPEMVKSVEKRLQEQIPYVIGGEDRLQNLLENADALTQQTLLSSIAKGDATLAGRLKKQLISLDDLAQLEGPALAAIVRRVNIRMLANVLRPMDAALQEKILGNLSPGSAAMLKEEINLAKNLPPQRLALEQKKILDALRRLSDDGIIVLKK